MKVKQAMSRAPLAIDEGASLQAALPMMNEHSIRHLPVVDRGKLVGVISSRDLLTTACGSTHSRHPGPLLWARYARAMKDHSITKAKLEKRLAELISRAERVDEKLSDRGPRDWDDNSLESEGDEVLDAVGIATMEEARLIREAITAIDEGSYGVCSACGGAISAARIEALPEATMCIRCAEESAP